MSGCLWCWFFQGSADYVGSIIHALPPGRSKFARIGELQCGSKNSLDLSRDSLSPDCGGVSGYHSLRRRWNSWSHSTSLRRTSSSSFRRTLQSSLVRLDILQSPAHRSWSMSSEDRSTGREWWYQWCGYLIFAVFFMWSIGDWNRNLSESGRYQWWRWTATIWGWTLTNALDFQSETSARSNKASFTVCYQLDGWWKIPTDKKPVAIECYSTSRSVSCSLAELPSEGRSFLFRPYFDALIKALECHENDQLCFYALSVLLTMTTNPCEWMVMMVSSDREFLVFSGG